MKNKKNILIIAKLSDAKLLSKLEPLTKVESVGSIYLVRKTPLSNSKIKSYYPPKSLRFFPFVEMYRIAAILYLLLTKKIDLIIGIHFILHGIYAGIFGALFNKKYILLFTENPGLHGKGMLYRFLLKWAFRVGVRGSKSRELVTEAGADPKKVFIPHNVFSFEAGGGRQNSKKEYDLIFVGNFVKDKRPDIFVNAVMLGDGVLRREVRDLIAKYNLQENISTLGWKNNVLDYLGKSKILVLTSETEGLPSVLIEALNLGIPCVVSNVGDVADLAVDNVNSLVVQSLNPEEFSLACHKLLTDNDLYQRLSQNARKITSEKKYEYSIENLVNIWEEICVEL